MGCAAASLWIVDYDKRELWTRASSGNKKDDAVVRRPFGCGIVGDVAATGTVSNVADCSTHPAFDVSVDADGVTGFTTHSALTGPVVDEHGRVVAVVQLVNKGGGGDGKGKGQTGGERGGSREEWLVRLREKGGEEEANVRRERQAAAGDDVHTSPSFMTMEHKIPTT